MYRNYTTLKQFNENPERFVFFVDFSRKLAKKYKTRTFYITLCRQLALEKGFSREDVMDFADLKMNKTPRRKRAHSKKYYEGVFNFLEPLSDQQWEDITKPTMYDKSKGST